MKKLGINTVVGILDIIASVIYFFAIFIIFAGAASKSADGASNAATGIFGFAVICLILHCYALIKSKQANMKITGHVLGIIGHGIYAVLGALLGIPAMILCILAAIFTLINNKTREE